MPTALEFNNIIKQCRFDLVRIKIQLGFFLINYIIYACEGISGVHFSWYALLFPFLAAMYAGLTLGFGAFAGWRWLTYSFVFMAVLLAWGVVVFNRVQKSFMDTV